MPGRVVNYGRLRYWDRVVQFRECNACPTELNPIHEHPVLLQVVEIEPPDGDWVRLRFDDGTGLMIDRRARAVVELSDRHLTEILAEVRELGENHGVIASDAAADDDTPIDTIRTMAQRIDAGLLDDVEPRSVLSADEADGYTYEQLFWHVGLTALPSNLPVESAALDDVTAKVLSAFEESFRAAYRESAIAYVRERIDEVGEPEDDADEEVAQTPFTGWWIFRDHLDTMRLLEQGHDREDSPIVDGLNPYRFQGYEGLVYATEDGLRVTWGERGPTRGVPPKDLVAVIDDVGLYTRRHRSTAGLPGGSSQEASPT